MKCLANLDNHCACYNVTSVGRADTSVVNMEVREISVDISFKIDGKAARSSDGASSVTVCGIVNCGDIKKGDVLRRRDNATVTDTTWQEVQRTAKKVEPTEADAEPTPDKKKSKGSKGQKEL